MSDNTKRTIRKPSAAGLFYPGNSVELVKTIAGLFAEVEKVPLDGRPIGIVSPHAGYPYSGKTAAKAFKLLEGEQYDSVVVVSPSHAIFFKGSSVYDGDGYETPIGVIEIDKALSKRLAEMNPAVYFSNMGHATGSTRGEHALEVILPFLQVVLGQFRLVAVVMGDQEPGSVRALGETMGSALKGSNTLMVASTDLSHFHSEKRARRLDYAIQDAIEKYDPEYLLETLGSGRGEACGGGPVAAMMMAGKRLGGKSVKFIDYTTSGATTGNFDEVVGYLSAAIVSDLKPGAQAKPVGQRQAAPEKVGDFTDDDKKLLLQIARNAIRAKLTGEQYSPPESEALAAKRGAFVTLKIDGELRGCIGQIRATEPLYKLIAEMALAAAFEDPRFSRLTEAELDRLEYEISVLSPLERVRDWSEIEIGRHGLMIKMDYHSGLLLPQVATEHGWTVTEFLEQTCLKAGLPKNSYKDKFAEVYKFSADVF
jgi:hypothetical protein